MLIVSSHVHQSVVVGELDGLESMLKVTVLEVRGTKVQLGFEVLPSEPSRPSEGVERLPDAPSGSSANQGMDSTQDWAWTEEAADSKRRTDD